VEKLWGLALNFRKAVNDVEIFEVRTL